MRVLVTGSRELDEPTTVFRVLHQYRDRNELLIVRHGACPKGADLYAHQWCKMLDGKGVVEESYPADWDNFGKAAGPIRNAQMINDGGIDLVLAFPRGIAKGTMNCVDLAQRFGLKILFG